MARKFVSMRNLKFLLYEVFDVIELTEYPYFKQHNRKMFDMVLDAALKLATKLMWPIFEKIINAAKQIPVLKTLAEQLDDALKKLQMVTIHLTSIAQKKGPEVFLADATIYLELFGIVSIAWQWLLQAIAAQKAMQDDLSAAESNFYQGKYYTCRYFFG